MKIMVSACLLPCAVREELADAVRARHNQESQLRNKTTI